MTDNQINNPLLRPCPFCNSEAQWGYSAGAPSCVYCINLDCRATVHFHTMRYETPEDIANHWNTRKQLVNV